MKGPGYLDETFRELRRLFDAEALYRPLRVRRHEPGETLEFDIRGVWPPRPARVKLAVERYVGGGYAGQVYRVRVLEIGAPEGPVEGLEKGGVYALKVLVPVSGLGRAIRNTLFGVAFQGPFSPQVNPDAARAGALWQKFIRRGAKVRWGSERAVVDVLATLVDPTLGSCGELSEWVDGRLWRYEIDDDLFARLGWKPGCPAEGLGSPEYRSKRTFMKDLVGLMHDMGAHELARQYEWWTMKSQPNALKRMAAEADPDKGLVAVDFRAGMALLPFLPQCPADFKLIVRGVTRGSLVQFDRGDIRELEAYVAAHGPSFADMAGALEELKRADQAYRDSLPDIAHHHIRLVTKPRLWTSIHAAWVRGWEVRNMADPAVAGRLQKHPPAALAFLILGLLPLLTPALFLVEFPGRAGALWPLWLAPLLGPFIRKLWGKRDYRRHVGSILTEARYLGRAFRGHVAEALIGWHRSGRVSEKRALSIAGKPGLYLLHLPLAVLPPGLHRFVTDGKYFKEKLAFIFVRPFRLYFQPAVREKWLTDMVHEGERRGMLTAAEAGHILSQIKEPFIQKYLKSLAVHVLTLPITQIVSVAIAFIYVRTHPELTWQQASVAAGVILGLFQVTPISPGSFARGLYTTFLVVKERNFRDYKMAFAISYFKYIGYLAFPLQMAYRYPELARFMAGHWSTGAVHIVPVFGERGAWLEHAVFDMFYNYPLSLGIRVRRRDERAASRKPRAWAVPAAVLSGTVLLTLLDGIFALTRGRAPVLNDVWWAAVWVPFIAGFAASTWSRRSKMGRRMAAGVMAGAFIGLGYGIVSLFVSPLFAAVPAEAAVPITLDAAAIRILWKVFIFSLMAIIGAFLAETRPPSAT
jgi:hypothetical protein